MQWYPCLFLLKELAHDWIFDVAKSIESLVGVFSSSNWWVFFLLYWRLYNKCIMSPFPFLPPMTPMFPLYSLKFTATFFMAVACIYVHVNVCVCVHEYIFLNTVCIMFLVWTSGLSTWYWTPAPVPFPEDGHFFHSQPSSAASSSLCGVEARPVHFGLSLSSLFSQCLGSHVYEILRAQHLTLLRDAPHSKLPNPPALTIFLLHLLQYSLSLGCGGVLYMYPLELLQVCILIGMFSVMVSVVACIFFLLIFI